MRTDRWNKKRELNLYAFYDHTGLERHLEKMATNGWMLESVGTYALRYRRCEPKKLRFAVVYYPKTDSFCPDEPNHENLTFGILRRRGLADRYAARRHAHFLQRGP